MIYPDKTFKKSATETDIINAGIEEHHCGTTFLTLSTPNGGETIEQNSTWTIKWSSNVSGDLKIDLLKGGSPSATITSSTPNSGSYDWDVTTDYVAGDDYKIKISSLDNDTVVAESNNNFSIIEENIIAIPYLQTFDGWRVNNRDTEYWEQAGDDDIDWTIQTGPTPSRVGGTPDKTGAEADHTSGSGKYIYIEASDPNNPSKVTSIVTPKFDFTSMQNPALSLYYHMFSADDQMGSFHVDIKVGESDWQDNIVEITGDQGDAWTQKTMDLSSVTQNNQRVRFRLRGITGSSWQSDICIDDFQIHEGVTPIANTKSAPSIHKLTFYDSGIHYRIPEIGKKVHVNITLYNVQGKHVKTLVDKNQEAGSYSVTLNKRQLFASGVYLCRMETEGFQKTIMILNR